MESKLIKLSADGATATVATASVSDLVTTLASTDEAVTGMYGFVQRVGLVLGGMALQNWRITGAWNPLSVKS